MFSDREVARKIMDLMKQISGELDNSLVDLRGNIPDDEFKIYRRAVGHVLAEVLGEVTYPIGELYPDLRYWDEA